VPDAGQKPVDRLGAGLENDVFLMSGDLVVRLRRQLDPRLRAAECDARPHSWPVPGGGQPTVRSILRRHDVGQAPKGHHDGDVESARRG